jgi:hypothetical protein
MIPAFHHSNWDEGPDLPYTNSGVLTTIFPSFVKPLFFVSFFAKLIHRGMRHPVFHWYTDWGMDFPKCWRRLVRHALIYTADAAHKVNHFEFAIQVFALKVGNRNAGRH